MGVAVRIKQAPIRQFAIAHAVRAAARFMRSAATAAARRMLSLPSPKLPCSPCKRVCPAQTFLAPQISSSTRCTGRTSCRELHAAAACAASAACATSTKGAAAGAMEARCYAPSVSWDPEVEAYLAAALGEEQLRRVSEALTRPPLATCLRVNTLRTTPEVGWAGRSAGGGAGVALVAEQAWAEPKRRPDARASDVGRRRRQARLPGDAQLRPSPRSPPPACRRAGAAG